MTLTAFTGTALTYWLLDTGYWVPVTEKITA